jgi:hypothetical protein
VKLSQIATLQCSTIERMIAYGYARSDIETRLPSKRHLDGPHAGWWYDLRGADQGPAAEDIGLAVRYLTLRGLLLTHPRHEHLVRPLDETEGRVHRAGPLPRLHRARKGGRT